MQYLLLLLSCLLYYTAPSDYNSFYCNSSFVIFCIAALYGVFRLRRIEFFGFNLLFTLSFFGCCYIFPVFIYNIDSSYALFHHGYDYKVISKATSLASMAYSCYLCGLLRKLPILDKENTHCFSDSYYLYSSKINTNYIFYLSIVFFILFILVGGYNYFSNLYSNGEAKGGIVTYFYVLVTLIPVLLAYIETLNFKKEYIIASGIFIILFLTTGSRTIPLAIVLGMVYVCSQKFVISPYYILLILLLGFFTMAIIGTMRGGEAVPSDSAVGGWNFFLDLIVNNRNLFDAYSFVQTKGYIPAVLIGPILGVIPLGQSLFCSLTGTPSYDMSSAMYITVQNFGPNPPVGLGTNIVGDVYLGGGLIAVIVLFYLLGSWITKALYHIYLNKSIYWYIFYLIMITNSIFICRGSFFIFLRPYLWTIFILWVLKAYTYTVNKYKYLLNN